MVNNKLSVLLNALKLKELYEQGKISRKKYEESLKILQEVSKIELDKAYDNKIKQLFKEIATALNLNYKKTWFGLQDYHHLYNDEFNFYFMVSVTPKEIFISTKSFTTNLFHLRCNKEQIDKAKRELIVKITEKLKEKK